jgi:hypothetical protein
MQLGRTHAALQVWTCAEWPYTSLSEELGRKVPVLFTCFRKQEEKAAMIEMDKEKKQAARAEKKAEKEAALFVKEEAKSLKQRAEREQKSKEAADNRAKQEDDKKKVQAAAKESARKKFEEQKVTEEERNMLSPKQVEDLINHVSPLKEHLKDAEVKMLMESKTIAVGRMKHQVAKILSRIILKKHPDKARTPEEQLTKTKEFQAVFPLLKRLRKFTESGPETPQKRNEDMAR